MKKLLLTGAMSVLIFSGVNAAAPDKKLAGHHDDMKSHDDGAHKDDDMKGHDNDMHKKCDDLGKKLKTLDTTIKSVSDKNTAAALGAICDCLKAQHKMEKEHREFMEKHRDQWHHNDGDKDGDKDSDKDSDKKHAGKKDTKKN